MSYFSDLTFELLPVFLLVEQMASS